MTEQHVSVTNLIVFGQNDLNVYGPQEIMILYGNK